MPRPPARTVPTARPTSTALPPLGDDVHAWPGREVAVGPTRVFVRTTPATGDAAEPALLVHGLGGSALNWTDYAALLRDRLAIEAIDLPGHGRSGPSPDNDYSIANHARIVIGHLEQSGRGPVHLIGNSMGGTVSIVVAALRPDLIRTLTLISPAVPDNRPRIYPLRNDPRLAAIIVPVLGEALAKRFNARVAVEARVKGTIALCFADRSRYPDARLNEAIDEARERESLPWAITGMLRSLRGLARWQLLHGRAGWGLLTRIAAPTLVVWGDRDNLVAPDLAPYVAATIRDSRLLVLPDIGHTAMMEDPATTARVTLGLLEDAASAPAP